MSEFNSGMEMLNDLVQERGTEIPDISDYSGEKGFLEAFADSLRSFLDAFFGSEGKDVTGTEGTETSGKGSSDTSSESSEFNEALTEKASQAMAEVFDTKTMSEWGSMSLEQREAKLNEFYVKLGETLGIDTKGVVVEDLYSTVGEGVLGYNSGDGYIHIDYRALQDPSQFMQVLDTTIHETRHQLQAEAIEDPSRFPEISPSLIGEWEHNMQNYDSGEYGFEGYYNQVVEVDARVFAADVIAGYKNIVGL